MLKKIAYGVVFLAVLLVSILAANAAPTITVSSGSVTTYGPGESFTIPITVSTNSTTALTSTVAITGQPLFNLTANPSTVTIPAAGSTTFSVQGVVPSKNINVENTYSATVTVTSGAVSGAGIASIKPRSMLRFSNLEIKTGTNAKRGITDGKRIENIRPGDTITVTGKVNNKYPGRSDLEIDDVEVILKGDDDDVDVDDSEDLGTISEDDDDTFSFSFDIPSDIDERTVNMDLDVDGTDYNGVYHYERISFSMRIEKKDDDIKIQSYSISPSLISCTRNFDLRIVLENAGNDDQRQAALSIENYDLGIKDKEDLITLEADVDSDLNTYSKTFRHTLPNAAPGVYDFKFLAYYDDDRATDSKIATLTIEECNKNTPTTVVQQPLTTTPTTVVFNTGQQPVNFGQTTNDSKAAFSDSTYLAVLIGAIVVVAVLGFAMIAYLFKPK